MEENIEVKDVQKTEYLDKNGLDMLWAKVKENTRNQVEAESNRAVTQETRIIETKADKAELNNYVSDTALKALEKKVSANTAAISNKQNAGNYLHYETLNNEGYYEIPSVCISGSDGSTKTDIDSQNISVNGNDGTTASIASDEIRVSNEALGYTIITCDKVRHYYDDEGSLGFDLNSDGVKLQGGDDNHVLTSNGSTIDIRDYAKKTDIQADGKFVPYVKKGANHYNGADTYFLSNGLQFGDAQTNHTVILPQAFDARQDNRNLQLSVDSFSKYAINILDYGTNKGMKVLWNPIKLAFTPEDNNTDSGTTYSLAGVRLYAVNSSKKPENTLVLGTDEDYKEIGVDIAPLENGKVPAKYLDLTQYALSSTLAALEQKVTDNTTVISGKQDAGNYIPYKMLAFKNKYVIEPSYSIEFRTDALNNKYGKAFIGPQIISITSASGQNAAVEPEEISIKQSGNASGRIHSTLNVDSFGVYNNNDDSVIFKLNQYGIKLEDGDDNHVLTSNASTIDIREYALKSVYDKKIASLEARIVELEGKLIPPV